MPLSTPAGDRVILQRGITLPTAPRVKLAVFETHGREDPNVVGVIVLLKVPRIKEVGKSESKERQRQRCGGRSAMGFQRVLTSRACVDALGALRAHAC